MWNKTFASCYWKYNLEKNYIKLKINSWSQQLDVLSQIHEF